MAESSRIANRKADEAGHGFALSPVRLLTFGFGFSLTANYLLMPARDAQLLFLGNHNASKLLVVTSLFAIPFSAVSSYLVRPTVKKTTESFSWFFRAYALLALASFACLPTHHTNDTNVVSIQYLIVSIFFVVFELFKLLATSLLWSLSTDITDSSKNLGYASLYGLSCTTGQVVGSFLSYYMLDFGLTTSHLFLSAAVFLELCARCIAHIGASTSEKEAPTSSSQTVAQEPSLMEKFSVILMDRYLQMIVLYTLCYTITMNMIYVEKIAILEESELDANGAASFSATLNVLSAILTMGLQLLLTSGSLVKVFGVSFGLYALPLVTGAGFISLSLVARAPLTIGVFEVSRRVTAFAVSKPSRESLYGVVPRERKYLAKSIIDTFVYRLGGGLGALVFDLTKFLVTIGKHHYVQMCQISIIVVWVATSTMILNQMANMERIAGKAKEL